MSDTEAEQPSRLEFVGSICAGAGLGLLLGLIVGLSKTPVVAGVVGTLTGLLAVFLGLQAGGANLPVIGKVKIDGFRIGSFGFATSAGLILGLFIRVTNPFGETPEEQYAHWKTAFGDNEVLARQAMIYERTGLRPRTFYFTPDKGTEISKEEGVGNEGASLVGKARTASYCRDLDPKAADNDVDEILYRYNNRKDDTLTAMANYVDTLSKEYRLGALYGYHAQFCGKEIME